MPQDILDTLTVMGERSGYLLTVVLIAIFSGILARLLILRILKSTDGASQVLLDALRARGVARIAPTLVSVGIISELPPVGFDSTGLLPYIQPALSALLILLGASLISRLLSVAVDVAERSDVAQRLPVKVFTQAIGIAVWAYAALMLFSVILNKDVSTLLAGMTAAGALLVYVFRDYILAWNAAVQIATNDLVQEGDWIVVKGHDADGHVADIGLTTVKIRNWDKSISVVPSYDIVSKGCRNMRFMFESGGRRIKRRFTVDGRRVRLCDQALLARLDDDARVQKIFKATGLEVMTNLALFRRWLADWLSDHPDINSEMTCLVRELNDEGNGVVIEMYAFTATTKWVDHERIKADVHDRVIAELHRFDLGLFQRPGGAELAKLDTV